MTVAATVRAPILYEPSMEVPEPDETHTQDELDRTLLRISETTYKDGGKPLRSVHSKSHGLLRVTFQVLEGLPPELAQGICATARSYEGIIRLSTTPGDILDDSVSTPRAAALKLVGVQGGRLAGAKGAATQDFVMVNGPAFAAPTAKRFAGNLKLLAATTDKAEGTKKVLSAALRGLERVVEAAGGKSGTLISLGGQPPTHILGDTFFSQVPLLWGSFMAKVSLAPVSSSLTALTGKAIELSGRPNALRDLVKAFFASDEAQWEFRVQLCRDLKSMPIEDASVVWPEDQSPYVAVARVTAGKQIAWSEERSRAVDSGMAFSPWHGIEAHRPIGSVMRVRKLAYETSAKFRAARGDEIREPASADELPA